MAQEITNQGSVSSQLNVQENTGQINFYTKSRLQARFEALQNEVSTNSRYEGVKNELKYYLTKLDGVDLETKLKDGNFTPSEIIKAERRKEKFAKQMELNRFFESAQLINSELFAQLIMAFEAHVEPLIVANEPKNVIANAVKTLVIDPLYQMINKEGQNDSVLNYNLEDLYGILFYLTGKCHVNWKDYDSIQSGI